MGGQGRRAWPLSFARCVVASLALAAASSPRAEPLELKSARRFESAALGLEPVNWLMARADMGTAARRGLEAKAAAAAAANPAAPQQPSANALMRLFFQDDAEGARRQLAPMRWRGSLGFEQRATSASDGSRRNQSIEHGSVELATFIGQPWLVQVRGHVGAVLEQSRSRGEPLASTTFDGARSASLTGGASVAVFPSSRFPFTASFESSDSRTSGEASAVDYVNRMLAVRQSYRSPLGDQVYGASLEHSTMIAANASRDSVTALNGAMQRRFGLHTLDVSGGYSRNRRPLDEGSNIARLAARHSYRPAEQLLTVDTYASFSMTDVSAGVTDMSTRFAQLNSFATWRPDEESPYFLTGGVRLADAALDGAGEAGNTARSVGANLAMSYALGAHLNLVGSVAATGVVAQGDSRFLTNQSVSATYTPAPRTLGPVDYSWTTSVGASNDTGSVDGNQHAVTAQAGHRVSKALHLGKSLGANASYSQNVQVQQDSLRGATTTLSHSGSLGLRIDPGPSSTAFLGLTAGESRSQGGRDERFRLLNLQLTGQLQLGVFSVVIANLTGQAIDQRHAGDERPRTDANNVQLAGSIAYRHARLFGVQRLRLLVSATFNDMQSETRLLGDALAPLAQYSRIYEQTLEYDIGRLDFRLGTRLATLDGKTDRQFFFRVNRQFGLY